MSANRAAVLVTGGAGYVGSHVCKALAAAGFLPVTYDNLSRGHAWAVKWGPLEQGDLRDGARLAQVLRQYRPVAVAHLAGYILVGESVEQPELYWDNNVAATEVLLEAMREAGIGRLVFSSSCSLYGHPAVQPIDEGQPADPLSPYAATKLAAEHLLREAADQWGLAWVALRYFNAAGADPALEIGEAHQPESHLIPLILAVAAGRSPAINIFGEDYPTADGTCVRDYVHVVDIGAAHLLALDHLAAGGENGAFNLGSSHGYSVREVIAIVEWVTGRAIPVAKAGRRPGDPPVLVGDCRRAAAILGWVPRFVSLEETITHAWGWYRKAEGI